MKTVGLIGGMTWHTSAVYYQRLNEGIQKQMGGDHSLKSIMVSLDFDEINGLQKQQKWSDIAKELIFQAENLRHCGADVLVLCSNTIHKVAPEIKKNVNLKLIHIGDALGEVIVQKNIRKVLLLGTRYTMLDTFYSDILKRYGVEVVMPSLEWINKIHHIIMHELVDGVIDETSKMRLIALIESYALQGVTGVILGCTELSFLIQEDDVSMQVLDTLDIHIKKIIKTII